jgi:mono/diheme cytochrome c family protein
VSGSTRRLARRPASLAAAAVLLAAGFFAWCGLAPHAPGAESAPAGEGASNAGELYRSHCAGCHGRDGQGNGLRKRGTDVPDFTSREWRRSRTDAQLTASILDGKGSAMPSFDDRLSRQEAKALVAHVRAFAPGAAPAAAAAPRAADPPDDFDARFRQLEVELEDLQRQFREASDRKHEP